MIRDDAVCLTCKYPLRGLAHPQCPECGRPFNPNDLHTYGPPRPRYWFVPGLSPVVIEMGAAACAGALAWSFTFCGTLALVARRSMSGIGPAFAILLAGITTTLMVFAVASILRALARRHDWY